MKNVIDVTKPILDKILEEALDAIEQEDFVRQSEIENRRARLRLGLGFQNNRKAS